MYFIDNHNPIQDYGDIPTVLELNKLALINKNYRASLWTGKHLQVTVMNIRPNKDVGVELHTDTDQILYIINGKAKVYFGDSKENLLPKCYAVLGDAVFVPSGTYHNVENVGFGELKIISFYAPPHHKQGTIQQDKPEE